MSDEISKRLSKLPRRGAPPSLRRSLHHAFLDAPKPGVWKTFWDSFLWRPAGALAAAAALAVGVFVFTSDSRDNSMDLQPLIAAHMRYQAESLVPNADPAHSNLSAQLASYYERNN